MTQPRSSIFICSNLRKLCFPKMYFTLLPWQFREKCGLSALLNAYCTREILCSLIFLMRNSTGIFHSIAFLIALKIQIWFCFFHQKHLLKFAETGTKLGLIKTLFSEFMNFSLWLPDIGFTNRPYIAYHPENFLKEIKHFVPNEKSNVSRNHKKFYII